jgi:hydrogenase/urease accessory protein HupE
VTARLRLACLLALSLSAPLAHADVFRPAYLELREVGGGRYEVLWKVPADRRFAGRVRFPEGTVQTSVRRGVAAGGAHVERWTIERPGGLVGQTLRIEGLEGGATDVLARVERADGTSQVERLLPERPQLTLAAPPGLAQVARSHLVFGVEHILGGVDHLLFVLALLLIVRGGRRIVATVTAFTAGHSLTLAAATLGLVRVPSAPVEAVIALSIAFVAAEVVHGLRGRPGLTARAPWLAALGFGLLHGFGFAGALAEAGLPSQAIPLALFAFNVGVELGQLVFVAAVLALRAALARLPLRAPRWVAYAPPYAIGTLAAMWTLERIAAF